MPLDSTKPTDQALNSEWPSWIRAIHAYVNNLEASIPSGSFMVINNLTIAAGDTSLSIGVDLAAQLLEVIFVTGTGAATLQYIYGGTNGQIKIFIFLNNVVSMRDGAKSGAQFYLNQLPVLSDFVAQEGDVLVLTNVGGNGSSLQGYWREVYRQIVVK